MLRVLIFGFASLVVFTGLVKISPLLDNNISGDLLISTSVQADPAWLNSSVPPNTTPAEEEVQEELPADTASFVGEDPSRLSCIISSNPSTISRGESTSIAWGSENASFASLSDTGTVSPQGGMFVSPIETTSYTLTVYRSDSESSSCKTEITVH